MLIQEPQCVGQNGYQYSTGISIRYGHNHTSSTLTTIAQLIYWLHMTGILLLQDQSQDTNYNQQVQTTCTLNTIVCI